MGVFVSAALTLVGAMGGGAHDSLAKHRFGLSSQGRPLRVERLGNTRASQRVLVVGCTHGDECAGSAVTRAVRRQRCLPAGSALWLVHNLNPDGLRIGTRLNGRGVDLNRNFATAWRPIGAPGDLEHSGPRPFSEPETRAVRRLIRAFRPHVTVWFHQQAERLVRAWGPSIPAARAYARAARLPFQPLPWMDGTAPHWQNHEFPGTASFVVEMPLGKPSAPAIRRHTNAVARLAKTR